jgi:hypothetical protein
VAVSIPTQGADEGGRAEEEEGVAVESKAPELPPYTEAVARANFHTQRLILPEVTSVTLQYMQCVLPPPAQAVQLIYAAALMCGVRDADVKDDCGDISWDKLKAVRPLTRIMHQSTAFICTPTLPS